jgi:hypothetical protein
MLVSGVLFVLVLAGCWAYCLADAVLTPAVVFRGWPKAAWVGIIAVTFAVGAVAWLVYRTKLRHRTVSRGKSWPTSGYATGPRVIAPPATPTHTYLYWDSRWAATEASVARHPAGRFRKIPGEAWPCPKGPDDDPGFLRELDRRIKGTSAEDPE